MIIELCDTLMVGKNLPYVEVAVEAVCHSVARGEHALSASRGLLAYFINNDRLSQRTRGLLQSIQGNYAFISGLKNQVEFRVRIVNAEAQFFRVDAHTWNLSAAHVARTGIRPTVLLCENSTDGTYYLQAARHYALEQRNTDPVIQLEVRNGNGGGIPDELQIIVDRQSEFCLCITDSDKFSPEGQLGANSVACEAVVSGNHWVVRHQTTFGRELENEFPTALVRDACDQLESWERYVTALSRVPEAAPFSDMKNGTTVCWVRAQPIGSPARQFWDNNAVKMLGVPSEEYICGKPGGCIRNECEEMIIPKLASTVAERVGSHLEMHSAHKVLERAKTSANFDKWIQLGREVFALGVAASPQRL